MQIDGLYGFLTAEPARDGWAMALRNATGEPVVTCLVAAGDVLCVP